MAEISEEDVERVARALASVDGDDFNTLASDSRQWAYLNPQHDEPTWLMTQADYREMARAAIEAYLSGSTGYQAGFRAGVEATMETLEPFDDALASVAGEGTEDHPDSEPVIIKCGRHTHHSMRLGDFRKMIEIIRALPVTGEK